MANLMIVDDDGDIIDMLAEILRANGHEVSTATTGEDGLVALRAAPLPDAILLDVDMPGLSGPGMAHKMMLHDAGEEQIPVLLISANGNLQIIAATMGTPYSIAKPFDVDALLALVDRAVREHESPATA